MESRSQVTAPPIVAVFPRLNLLFSYAYFVRCAPAFREAAEALMPYANVLIDSGAFTNRSEQEKAARLGKRVRIITLDEYNNACRAWVDKAEYIQLDVIGDPAGTARNLQASLDAGLSPIPVYTPGADPSILPSLLAADHGRVCFGGLAAYGEDGIARMVSRLWTDSGGALKAHLLGYGRYPRLMTLPLATCDSSSYTAGGKFGSLMYFDPAQGVTAISWTVLGKAGPKTRQAIGLMRQYEIPLDLMQQSGSYIKAYGIPALTATWAYMALSRFAAQHQRGYYLAVVNNNWLTPILATLAAQTHHGFDYPLAREIKRGLDAGFSAGQNTATIEQCVQIVRQHTQWQKLPLYLEKETA